MYLCIYLCKRLARTTKKPADSGFSICYFIQRYTLLVQHLLFHPEIHTAVSRACHFTQRFPMEGDCVGVHTWTGRGLGQLRGGTGAGERKRGRDTWVDTAVRQQLFREFFMHLPCHSETCRPSLQKVGAHIFSLSKLAKSIGSLKHWNKETLWTQVSASVISPRDTHYWFSICYFTQRYTLRFRACHFTQRFPTLFHDFLTPTL